MQNTEPKLWLHRLFNSEYFETWLLVSYLYRYTTPGIHFYLVCKLRLRPKEEILKVLPHLVHICNTHNSSPLFYFLCDQSIECFFQVREYEEMSLRIIKKFKKKSKFIQNRKEEKKFVFKSTEKKYFNLENLSYKSFPCSQIPYENKNSINLQGILLHITETIALIFDTKLCDNLDNYKKIFKTKEIKKVHKKEESLFSGKIFRKNNLILPTILFMDELVNISKRLKLLPRNIRQKGLEIEIGMLNYNLPADVFLMGSEDKKVVNVVSEFSFVLDSAENSPFFVVFELVNRNVILDEKNFIIEEEIEDNRNKQIKEPDQKPVKENSFEYNFNDKNNIGLCCKDPELIDKSQNSDQKLIECYIDNSNDIKLHEDIKVKKCEDYDNYTVKKENFLETITDRQELDIDKNNINEDQKEIKTAFTKSTIHQNQCYNNDIKENVTKNLSLIDLSDNFSELKNDKSIDLDIKCDEDAKNISEKIKILNENCNLILQEKILKNPAYSAKNNEDQDKLFGENEKINIENYIPINDNVKLEKNLKTFEKSLDKNDTNNNSYLADIFYNKFESSEKIDDSHKEESDSTMKTIDPVKKNLKMEKYKQLGFNNVENNSFSRLYTNQEIENVIKIKKNDKSKKKTKFAKNKSKNHSKIVIETNKIENKNKKSDLAIIIDLKKDKKDKDENIDKEIFSYEMINVNRKDYLGKRIIDTSLVYKNGAFLLNQLYDLQKKNNSNNTEVNLIKENIINKIEGINSKLKENLSFTWDEKLNKIKNNSNYKDLEGYEIKSAIIKRGNDIRQEILALQLLNEIKKIFNEENLNIYINCYKIYMIDGKSAIVEAVNDVESIHNIKKRDKSLKYFLMKHNQDEKDFQAALMNFTTSLVGYSLATYFLQLKDRHNGNILLDKEGHLIHVDFGFILGNHPGFYNVERAPFKFSAEYLDVLNETLFKSLFLEGFLALRRNSDRLCRILEILSEKSKLKNLNLSTLNAFRERFRMDLGDKEIEKYVSGLITWSINSIGTGLYDSYQYFSHGYMK